MTKTEDRRTSAPAPEDDFSPEYLAVLVVCGGSVRDSDWSLLPDALFSRRPRADESPSLPVLPDR